MSAIKVFPARSTPIRGLLCVITALSSSACLIPRKPLIAPVPVTQGATVVSPKGVNLAISGGTGLLGQRQEDTGASAIRFGWGLGSRVGASFGFYGGTEENVTGGMLGQLKVQGTPLFGGRGLWGVHLAAARGSADTPAQDETLIMLDVALPIEILLASDTNNRLSAYVGPRFMHRSFTDRNNAAGSLKSSYPGLLAGVLGKFSGLRILAEVTVAQLPEDTYRGQRVGGRTAVMPMIEIGYTIGTDLGWPGSTKKEMKQ